MASVGAIREEMSTQVRTGKFDIGISKPDYIDLKSMKRWSSLQDRPAGDGQAGGSRLLLRRE